MAPLKTEHKATTASHFDMNLRAGKLTGGSICIPVPDGNKDLCLDGTLPWTMPVGRTFPTKADQSLFKLSIQGKGQEGQGQGI